MSEIELKEVWDTILKENPDFAYYVANIYKVKGNSIISKFMENEKETLPSTNKEV